MNKPTTLKVGEFDRTHGELIEIQDVTPKVTKVEDYIFKATTAQVVARIDGKDIREFSTFNDYYGKGTCVEAAIREAKELQKYWGDSLEFVVVKHAEYCRTRPQKDAFFQDKIVYEALKCGCRANLHEDTEEVVWSSKEGA